MMLAYLDEVGEPGAFISKDDPRFNTSAAFGYAGFIIPDEHIRQFGSIFTHRKRQLFSSTRVGNESPVWEVKGASVFRSKTPEYAPQNIRVFRHLCGELLRLGGQLFYYVDEKPIGTPKQVRLDSEAVERRAMAEVLNRICRTSDTLNSNVLFMIDAISEDQRVKRLPNMYAHILSRTRDKPEMRRAVEPPMHVDSELSAAIQFADWVAAAIGRAVEYQLLAQDAYRWVGEALWPVRHALFTNHSKLHYLDGRSLPDLYRWDILKREKPLHTIGAVGRNADAARQMERMFQREITREK